MEYLINATVRRKDDDAGTTSGSKTYGYVVDETDTKAHVRWPNGAITWEQKRDLYVLS